MSTADSDEAKNADGSGGKKHHRVIAFLVEYWWLLTAVVVAAHLVAWGPGNPQTTTVHWVFFTTHNTPIGRAIAVAVILGAVLIVLITQQRARGAKASRRVRSAREVRDITRS